MKASYTYEYVRGYPTVVNHPAETNHIMHTVESIPDIQGLVCEAQMGGEDFAYYLEHVPGNFFFTGAKNPEWSEVYPHHHPKFDIAAKVLGQATLDYLK